MCRPTPSVWGSSRPPARRVCPPSPQGQGGYQTQLCAARLSPRSPLHHVAKGRMPTAWALHPRPPRAPMRQPEQPSSPPTPCPPPAKAMQRQLAALRRSRHSIAALPNARAARLSTRGDSRAGGRSQRSSPQHPPPPPPYPICQGPSGGGEVGRSERGGVGRLPPPWWTVSLRVGRHFTSAPPLQGGGRGCTYLARIRNADKKLDR